MLQSIFFRFGMRWRHRYMPLIWVAYAAIIVFGLASWHSVAAEQINVVITSSTSDFKSWKDSYRDALVACLNHGSFWFPDTGEAFECSAKPLGRVAK